MNAAIGLLASLLVISAHDAAAASARADQARICSTLGKVHAQRDRQLYPVSFQSLDGRLSTHRADSCITVTAGQHVLGLTSRTEFAAFPIRRAPKGSLKEQQLPLLVEARRTYTIAAQLDDRYQASWIPVVQSVQLWTPQP